MGVFVGKKTANKPAKASTAAGLINLLVRRPMPVPPLFLLLLLIIGWCASTFLSVSFFHVCISSRKLSLYCLSAGTQPNFHQLITHNVTDTISDNYITAHTHLVHDQTSTKNSSSVVGDRDRHYQNDQINTNNSIDIIGDHKKSQNDQTDTKNSTNIVEDHEQGHQNQIKTNSSINIVGDNGQGHLDQSNEMTETEKESAQAVVKEQMKSLRAASTPGNGSIRDCSGRGLFVYELPAKFNTELVSKCGDLLEGMCDQYFGNSALGDPIPELGDRWFNTHLYSLEPIFHNRVIKHSCRVYKAEEAKLFYVPFYGGIDILRWHFKNVSFEVKDSLGVELLNWLETQDSWKRNAGRDHVFVLGKISWDFRRKLPDNKWGSDLLQRDQMQNPIKLLLERHPWHINDIAVPHPTFFHPNSDADIANHQSKLASSQRRHLVAFAGADRPSKRESIRSVLIQQCKFSNGYCQFLECPGIECRLRPAPIIELFSSSEFCLQPPGDSATRKSVFDSLISGCIPVLFDPFTAYYQYPWHLPEDYTKYSVYVDQEMVREKKVEVVEMLSKISVEKREEMRRFIIYELMPGLVYGGANASFEKFDDAFTVSINNLFGLIKSRDG